MSDNSTRIFKAILGQALSDALYIPIKEDEKTEKEYQERLIRFKIDKEKGEQKYQEKVANFLSYKEKIEIKYKENLKKYFIRKGESKIKYKRNKPKMPPIRKPPKKAYLRNNPARLQDDFLFKRDALRWLYGQDKNDVWLLELCCDVCNVTQEQIIKVIEKHHKDKENFFEKK